MGLLTVIKPDLYQGYTQVPGFDFNYAFNLVIKASMVRIVLSLDVMRKWTLH